MGTAPLSVGRGVEEGVPAALGLAVPCALVAVLRESPPLALCSGEGEGMSEALAREEAVARGVAEGSSTVDVGVDCKDALGRKEVVGRGVGVGMGDAVPMPPAAPVAVGRRGVPVLVPVGVAECVELEEGLFSLGGEGVALPEGVPDCRPGVPVAGGVLLPPTPVPDVAGLALGAREAEEPGLVVAAVVRVAVPTAVAVAARAGEAVGGEEAVGRAVALLRGAVGERDGEGVAEAVRVPSPALADSVGVADVVMETLALAVEVGVGAEELVGGGEADTVGVPVAVAVGVMPAEAVRAPVGVVRAEGEAEGLPSALALAAPARDTVGCSVRVALPERVTEALPEALAAGEGEAKGVPVGAGPVRVTVRDIEGEGLTVREGAAAEGVGIWPEGVRWGVREVGGEGVGAPLPEAARGLLRVGLGVGESVAGWGEGEVVGDSVSDCPGVPVGGALGVPAAAGEGVSAVDALWAGDAVGAALPVPAAPRGPDVEGEGEALALAVARVLREGEGVGRGEAVGSRGVSEAAALGEEAPLSEPVGVLLHCALGLAEELGQAEDEAESVGWEVAEGQGVLDVLPWPLAEGGGEREEEGVGVPAPGDSEAVGQSVALPELLLESRAGAREALPAPPLAEAGTEADSVALAEPVPEPPAPPRLLVELTLGLREREGEGEGEGVSDAAAEADAQGVGLRERAGKTLLEAQGVARPEMEGERETRALGDVEMEGCMEREGVKVGGRPVKEERGGEAEARREAVGKGALALLLAVPPPAPAAVPVPERVAQGEAEVSVVEVGEWQGRAVKEGWKEGVEGVEAVEEVLGLALAGPVRVAVVEWEGQGVLLALLVRLGEGVVRVERDGRALGVAAAMGEALMAGERVGGGERVTDTLSVLPVEEEWQGDEVWRLEGVPPPPGGEGVALPVSLARREDGLEEGDALPPPPSPLLAVGCRVAVGEALVAMLGVPPGGERVGEGVGDCVPPPSSPMAEAEAVGEGMALGVPAAAPRL